jgi:DNA-binding MarR family transcriptional regulator
LKAVRGLVFDHTDAAAPRGLMSNHMRADFVAAVRAAWAEQLPDLDTDPVAVVGRISRAARLLERATKAKLAEHGLEPWEYDVLAALRRSGPTATLSAGMLTASMLVTPGTMTNRIDRMVNRRLVATGIDPGDRRSTLVTLTRSGRTLVEAAAAGLMAVEQEAIAGLSVQRRQRLANLLQELLLTLGDDAPAERAITVATPRTGRRPRR